MIKHVCSNCNSELTVGSMAIECDNCRAVIYTYPGVYVHVKVDMPLPSKAKPYEEVALLHKQLAEMRAKVSDMEMQLDYYHKHYIPSTYPPQRLGPNMIGPNMFDPNTQYCGGVSSIDVRSDVYQKAVEQTKRAIEAAIRNSPAADE